MSFLTMNCITDKNYPSIYFLSDKDKINLLRENASNDFSLYSLLVEMIGYENITISNLKQGWCGKKLFETIEKPKYCSKMKFKIR